MAKSIEQQLHEAILAIDGALAKPAIVAAMTPLGYTRKKIFEGRALQRKAAMLQDTLAGSQGSRKEVTARLDSAFQEANKLYMKHIKAARLAIPAEDVKSWHNLRLDGLRKKTKSGWISQTQAFYNNVAPVQALLAQHNVSADELAQTQAMIEAVQAALVRSNDSKSQAQQAKEQRDNTMKELNAWMKKFMKAARFVFDDNKQQLEALGVVVPS